MIETIRNIVFQYMVWVIFIPFFIAVINQKRYSRELRSIFYYLILAVVTQVVSYILWLNSKPNLYLLHLYTILEFLILLWFYSIILKRFIPRFVFLLLAILFPLFAITDSLLLGNIYTSNIYGRSVEALIFIFLSVSWFVKTVTSNENTRLSFPWINYINFGFFIYFSGSSILFSFQGFVTELAKPLRMNIYSIHSLLLVILYLLITMGLWKFRTK